MADTPVNVAVPSNEWVDLYDVAGISRGSVLIVQSGCNVFVKDIDL